MKSGSKKLAPIVIQLSHPGIQVRIRPILREDGSVDMTAELQYSNGGKHDWDIHCSRSAKSEKDIGIIAAQMAAELSRKYEDRLHKNAVSANSDKPYTAAFDALDDEQRKSLVPPTRRSAKYIQQSLSELRIFLGLLDAHGLGVEEDKLDAVVEARRKLAESSKNAIKDPEATAATVNASIKTFNALYPALRAAQPDCHLPELHLPLLLGGRGAKREQVKVLPDEMLTMFAAVLWRMVGYGLTLGAALMLTGMARTAEACAPKFKHFLIYDDYAVFGVLYQSNGKLVPVNDLKTPSAYRLIVLPKFGRDLIVASKMHLESQGFSQAEIQELPAVSSPGDPRAMAAPNELSAFVRELLSLLGCDEGFWNSVEQMVEREPDLDGFGHINRDPSAYVLRRNGCTQYVNRCGMPPNLVDALMGHKLVDDPTNWFARVRMQNSWPEIAAAQERWVLDPEHSAHPGIRAVPLSEQTDLQLPQVSEAAFTAAEDGWYLFAFDAQEANDAVTITLPHPGASVELPAITLRSEEYPTIIGSVPPATLFPRTKKKAATLNLDTILKGGTRP